MNQSRQSIWNRDFVPSDEVRQAMSRFFGVGDSDQSTVETSQWAPRVDIREEDKRFVILVDVPGVDPSEIEVSMDKSILTIKGERKVDSEENGSKLTRQERVYGTFHRRFALPESADADGISAHGKHGVLEISIPKKPETTPRRITINTAS
ncbi:MAG: Hsp20/alpha crystallin family protein [Rhodanobacter sp.]|nr:MAG: Hsp20/alpha crystallin family protein [Rhodanobacter sp.]TAL98953.1 MAG: Hsp20/alpha crystallin family protein [Rhodanobacter sp.]TAM42354.1 MAG: Hsp20/alpha crystallin family protein [Rhodanobacter sp.]